MTIRFDPQAAYRMVGGAGVEAPAIPNAVPIGWTVTGTGVPRRTVAGTILAVEYFAPSLGHYFVTADSLEKSYLDSARIRGWERTGRSFWVLPPELSRAAGAAPVCRFYGRPEAGLDSHFYSASPDECEAVMRVFGHAWLLEADNVFEVVPADPASGACPSGSSAVYRVYNGRPDANHRYLSDRDVRNHMTNTGWIPEGYGQHAVVFCAPQ